MTALSLRVLPNPSSREDGVRFRTNVAGAARLTLYDVSGRLVRDLFDGTLEAGRHELQWNGRDEAGGTVSAGVYFVRISTTEGTGTARHVVLR